MRDLAARLLYEAEKPLFDHTPSDAHSRLAARKATVAVIRELAKTAGVIGENVFTGDRLAALASQIEAGGDR